MQFISRLCNLDTKRIILASQSPRRRELLQMVGLEFEIRPSAVEEAPAEYRDPVEYAKETTMSKLEWVSEHSPADLIIAADTIVVQNGKIYEKPKDRADAFAILKQLQGKTHRVITVVCLRSAHEDKSTHAVTEVTFNQLSDDEINAYLDTSEPYDKAGAYGIQGLGAIFIEKVNGCYFNVMGFPLSSFYQLLRGMKI